LLRIAPPHPEEFAPAHGVCAFSALAEKKPPTKTPKNASFLSCVIVDFIDLF